MQTPDGAAALATTSPAETASFTDADAPPRTRPSADEDLGGSLDVHELLAALQAMRVGDFSVRLQGERSGVAARVADAGLGADLKLPRLSKPFLQRDLAQVIAQQRRPAASRRQGVRVGH